MEEKVIDPRIPDNDRQADGMRTARLTFKLNHTMPYTDEYNAVLKARQSGRRQHDNGSANIDALARSEDRQTCNDYEQLPDDVCRRHHH